jgi:hypothetical protein
MDSAHRTHLAAKWFHVALFSAERVNSAIARHSAANLLNFSVEFIEPIEPMTLGNMRANGVRSLDVCCWVCHHRAIMSADPWPDHVAVPTFGPRMVCTKCGIIGADVRPNWQEQPPRESLTGRRW